MTAKSPPSEEDMQKLTDAVESILAAVDDRQQARMANTGASWTVLGGPLTVQELNSLRLMPSLGDNADLLQTLCSMLETHVDSASSVNLIEEVHQLLSKSKKLDYDGIKTKTTTNKSQLVEEWLQGVPNANQVSNTTANLGPGVLRFLVLRNGLEAANILLSLFASPHVDRKLVSQDTLEACVNLLRHHLTRHVVPTLTQTGHLMTTTKTQSPSNKTPIKTTTTPTPKKRQRSSDVNQELIKELKKVYKPLVTSVSLLLSLMETMEALVYLMPLEDSLIMTLSSASLSVFGMDPVATSLSQTHLLHMASIGMMIALCRQYAQHRSVLIQDVMGILLHLPTSKKTLRTLDVQLHTQCQAISALLCSLIQSCVTFPTYHQQEDEELHRDKQEGRTDKRRRVLLEESAQAHRETKLATAFESGLLACQKLCDGLVSQLLQRCARKGDDGGASEFRPVLTNLVDDLLVMQLMPEYPAAEMLLQTIGRGLSNDVMKAASRSAVEGTYLATAFDILGKIGASAAAILATHRERPLSISRQIQDNQKHKSEGKKVISCHCGRHHLVSVDMVECGICNGFYHAVCVGQAEGTEKWVCDDCNLKQMALEETRAFASLRSIRQATSRDQVPEIIETHVFRQLVLTHLANESDSTMGVRFAREFLLAQWVQQLESEDSSCGIDARVLAEQFLDIWDRPLANPITSQLGKNSPLNGDGCRRLMIALAATKSELVLSFPRQIGLLIQSLGDKNTSLRKLSVKALSQVVDTDPKLMMVPAIKNAVSQRFADEAKSVREAVVGLVGNYAVTVPELANSFHQSFMTRLTDEGVSVKKRTVKIFRDILMTNPSYRGRAAACAQMLLRAADPKEDDSVRDLIHELFTELWLEDSEVPSPVKRVAMAATAENGNSHENSGKRIQKSGVVTPNPSTPEKTPIPGKGESNLQIRCRFASSQMIDVVLVAGSKDMLTALLRDLLSGFSDSDKDRKAYDRKKRKQAASSHCAHLADALIESLLTLEENRGEDKEEFGRKLVATISTIGAIAEVSAQVVLRHVDTFIPYLKADNGIPPSLECKVVSEVCDMLYRVCRKMPKAELMNLAGGSLSQDLSNIATNFPSSALSSAVGTLCELGSHKALGNGNSFRKKALVLANSFYKYLVKSVTLTDDYSSSLKKVQNNVHRALSGLGFLCRGHDVDDEDLVWLGDKVGEPLEVVDEDITWDNMVENCYQIFSVYLTKSDIETKKCALRALAGIFISRPRVLLAMQQNGTLEAIMSPTSDPELQLQALRCWKEILLVEEARLESGDAKEKMDSNEKITLSKKISGDQDSDATLVGGVLTQHQKRLYAMTKDRDDRIRYACVDLLSHLLRQGLLNPFTTIPHLFGLQGDVEAPDTRALALKLLINEGEKRPDTLRQRICEGVKHAYKFQRLVHPEREPTASIAKADGKKTTFESIFGAIFMESIRRTKKQKQGLFLNLLGLFDSGEALESSKRQKGKAELPLLAFAAEVLAYLPYDTLNDPLFIIHYIQSVAAVHGAQLLDVIEKFLEEQGCPVDANDENTEEDFLEIAARVKPKNPVSAKEATPLRERKFDIVRFEQLCESASAFTLLLRLKAYLRKLYKLTETRCLEYTPNGQDRPFDKLSTSVSEMPQFDSRIAGFFRHEPADKDDPNEHDINKDNVILQYVEFRRLLRMEQTVGARIAESEDEGEEKEIETAEIVVDEEHNEDSDII